MTIPEYRFSKKELAQMKSYISCQQYFYMKVPKVVETRDALSLCMPEVKDFNQLYLYCS